MRILRIIKTLGALAYSHGNAVLLDNVPAFGKSLDILSRLPQAFPTPAAEGQSDCKKNISECMDCAASNLVITNLAVCQTGV